MARDRGTEESERRAQVEEGSLAEEQEIGLARVKVGAAWGLGHRRVKGDQLGN